MSEEASSAFEDMPMQCVECGADFVHSARDQEFYQEKGYQNLPKRCPDCRRARKQRAASGPREMHEATCSDCGKVARVPFPPTQGKPVYCDECFQRHRPAR